MQGPSLPYRTKRDDKGLLSKGMSTLVWGRPLTVRFGAVC